MFQILSNIRIIDKTKGLQVKRQVQSSEEYFKFFGCHFNGRAIALGA